MEMLAVARIIESVGLKHIDSLNRKKLSRDLDWAGTWHATIISQRDKPKCDRRINAALKAAKRFQQALVKLRDGDFPQIGVYLLEEESSFANRLRRFIVQAESALKPSPPGPEWQQEAAAQMANELHLGKRSPFEWLAGIALPRIFEEHFCRLARISRDKYGKASGPYVRFAITSLRELGISNRGRPFASDAIAKALTDARGNRSRRTLGKAL